MDLARLLQEHAAAQQKEEAAWQRVRAKEEMLRKRIERAKDQLERLDAKRQLIPRAPLWIDAVIRPIASELQRRYPHVHVEVLGPFGLGNEVAIHANRKLAEGERKAGEAIVASVTLRPGDPLKGELKLKDYSRNTGEHREGTIGAINRLNYPDVRVTSFEQIEKAFIESTEGRL